MRYVELTEEVATLVEGAFVLAGALHGRRTFASALYDEDEIPYRASTADGSAWELGVARYDAGANALLRLSTRISTGVWGTQPVEFAQPVAIACVAPAEALVMSGRVGGQPTVGVGGGQAQAGRSVAIGPTAFVHPDAFAGLAIGAVEGQGPHVTHPNAAVIGGGMSFAPDTEQWWSAVRWSGSEATWGAVSGDLMGWTGSPLVIDELRVLAARVHVIGVRDGDTAVWSAAADICVRRAAGAGAEIVGGSTLTPIGISAGVTAYAELLASEDGELIVRAHGAANQGWRWSASIIGTVGAGVGGDIAQPPPPPPMGG